MNLAFALPAGLTALAALSIPLLIHLRRRDEQHRTAFAALRWLPARARPRTRLRFEEWPLLLLRLLLLLALALLLAQPLLFGGPHAKRWLAVAPGVDPNAIPKAGAFDGERRWLAEGFPEVEHAAPKSRQPIGSLLRELDATLPADTQVTVLVPAVLEEADAVAPVLHRRVRWQVAAAATQAFSPAPDTRARPRPPLAVRYDDDEAPGLRYLRAAAIAWNASESRDPDRPSREESGAISQALPGTDTPLAWLASGPLPPALLDWVNRGGAVLVDVRAQVPRMPNEGIALWQDDAGTAVVRGIPYGRGRILQWARPLTPDALPQLLEPDFPERLWSLFAPAAPLPVRAHAQDYAPRTGASAWPERPRDLQAWLLALIATLFAIERVLATGRREATPA